MSLQPVELNKAYRLLQVGPTTMISAKHNGNANVMAAAWVSLVGINKVMAYISPQAYTRGLVEESGLFAVQIPVVSQMETVLYAGEHSYRDRPDKNHKIPTFYLKEFDIPLVEGCAGWLVCKVIPNAAYDWNIICLWEKLPARGVTIGFFAMDTGYLMKHLTNYEPYIMSPGGSFMPSAKEPGLTMVRAKTNTRVLLVLIQ